MTNLFLLHATEDAVCAETLCVRLTAQGYRIWREPHSLQVSDIIYPHATENAILGSAVVLLLLSTYAAYSIEIARHLSFAMDLKKTIVPIILDKIDLPAMLQNFTPLVVESPCSDVVAQLMQQSLLPPPDSTDPLIKLAELAASDLLTKRKAAVQQASTMLQRNHQRAAVVAILAYLAQDDPMIGVREPAQEVLNADARRQQALQTSPLFPFQQINATE